MRYAKIDWKWPEFETIFSTRQVFFSTSLPLYHLPLEKDMVLRLNKKLISLSPKDVFA